MNDDFWLAALPYFFGVKVKCVDHYSLEKIEDSDSTVWFDSNYEDPRMAKGEIDDWVI